MLCAPTYSSSKGGGALGILSLLILLLTVLELTHAATVRHGYGGEDLPMRLHAAHERGHIDIIAMHASRSKSGAEDMVVHIGGRGRVRSDGISIIQSLNSKKESEGSAVAFTPAQLDVGWIEACSPKKYIVLAENRGVRPLVIEDVRFDHDGFQLVTDPRGIALEPSQSVQLELLFVSAAAEHLHAFMILVTSDGEFALRVRGHSTPSSFNLTGLRVSVPIGSRLEHKISFHNPQPHAIRLREVFSFDGVGEIILPPAEPLTRNLADKSAPWDVPAHTSKIVARFVFSADGPPGRYQSSVRLMMPPNQFVIPIQIDVWNENFVIEPSDVDIGVFTDSHDRRDVFITFHNTGFRPVVIRELRILDSDGLDVFAELQSASPTIPPRSRVQHAVQLTIRSRENNHSGALNVLLQFKTNATETETLHRVNVRGYSMRGHISYPLEQTAFRLVAPEETPQADLTTAQETVEVGSVSRRKVTLKNDFNAALELESIYFNPACTDFAVKHFTTGIVQPSEHFPTITLVAHPHVDASPRTRVCILHVETNASVHHIPIVLHTGTARVTSSRSMQQFVDPSMAACTDDGETAASSDPDRLDGGSDVGSPTRRGMKSCRTVVLELGKIASSGILEEVVNFTNTSPVKLKGSLAPSSSQKRSTIETKISFHADPQLPVEVSALGAAWGRWDSENSMSSLPNERESIAAGQMMSLRVRFQFKGESGVFIDEIGIFHTEFETIRLFARYESVPGTIEPALQVIEIPEIHPGRMGFVDIPYQSTFEHNVSARDVVLSVTGSTNTSDVIGLWRLQTVFPANDTTYVTLFYFPPPFYDDCQRGRFYADCFVRNKSTLLATSKLSEYGSLVSAQDIADLVIREGEWTQEVDTKGVNRQRGARIETDVTLVMEAVQTTPVHLTAYMVRPNFFQQGDDSAHSTIAFPLMKMFHQFSEYITVYNPSDYAMDMELTIAESDRDLFYACDDDMTEFECLQEWQDIARERVQLSKQSRAILQNDTAQVYSPRAPSSIAQLFLKSRVVRVAGRSHAQLGPIFFFPSTVGEWTTDIYVRNELTHIERVGLSASSGLGELTVSLITRSKQLGVKQLTRQPVINGTIEFVVKYEDLESPSESPTAFRLLRTLRCANTGTYQIVLESLHISDTNSTGVFAIATDKSTGATQPIRSITLPPREAISLAIQFTVDCYYSRRESELAIATEDGVARYRLVGWLSTDAAFQCRRQHWSIQARQWGRLLWMGVTAFAVVTVAWAIWTLISDCWQPTEVKMKRDRKVPQSDTRASPSKDRARVEQEQEDLLDELSRVERQWSHSKTVHVANPTVDKLLASRRRLSKPVDGAPIARTQSIPAARNGNMKDPLCGADMEPLKSDNQAQEEEHQEVVASPTSSTLALADPKKQDDDEKDASFREDTVSEEGSDNQVDAELDEITWCAPGQSDVPQERGVGDELLAFGESLVFHDDWNALAFESLQSEIGRLLVTDDNRALDTPSMPPVLTTTSASDDRSDVANINGRAGVLDALSVAPPLLPMSSLFASAAPLSLPAIKKPAPPGFTPADANPEASRAAFQRLMQPNAAARPSFGPPGAVAHDSPVSSMQSAFSGRYSLFGSSFGSDNATFDPGANNSSSSGLMAGRIGGSRLLRTTRAGGLSRGNSDREDMLAPLSARSQLAALGGIEFPTSETDQL